MKTISRCLCLFAALSLATVVAFEDKKEKEFEAKCPVANKKIDKEKFVEYKEAKVYFCCGGCPDEFEKNTAKYSAKANHQLVGTKQFAQEKCPFSGGDLNKDKTITIDQVSVAFCCEKCQGKAKEMKEEEVLEAVFGDKPFEKGFKIVKEEKKDE